MPSVVAYHRPENLDEAAALAALPNSHVIGGGTVVVPRARRELGDGTTVVDLQALELNEIVDTDEGLRIGAMVRLGDLVNDERIPSLLRDLAQRELPSTLRNQATVGGTVALGDPDSVFAAGLLVHGAVIQMHKADDCLLAEYWSEQVDGIVTSVTVSTEGNSSSAATGRTPADVPIVSAVARRSGDKDRLALTGVASVPVEVQPDNPLVTIDGNEISPPADFRGSESYRRHLATVNAGRALKGLGE